MGGGAGRGRGLYKGTKENWTKISNFMFCLSFRINNVWQKLGKAVVLTLTCLRLSSGWLKFEHLMFN